MSDRVIKLSTTEEMNIEAKYHSNKCGIPGMIGAVDGSRIRIDPPRLNKDNYTYNKENVTLKLFPTTKGNLRTY